MNLDVNLALFLLTETFFFFFKFHALLEKYKSFSHILPHDINLFLLLGIFLDYFYSYLYFNQKFKISINYTWFLIWLHILVKSMYTHTHTHIYICIFIYIFELAKQFHKNLYFYILFHDIQVFLFFFLLKWLMSGFFIRDH